MDRILIVDDEEEITRLLKMYLENNLMQVDEAHDGLVAKQMLETTKYDLLLVDIMMPNLNGFELIKLVRQGLNLPIIIMSAKVNPGDKIFGLEIGADDYITKPFEPMEVVARVKANLRRYHQLGSDDHPGRILTHRDLIFNVDEMKVSLAGLPVDLTSLELRLLQLFMENPGRVFTNDQIFNSVWQDSMVDDNAIRVAISKLRAKIGEAYIKTIRGLGYRME